MVRIGSICALLASTGLASAQVERMCMDPAVGDYDVVWSGGGFVLYPVDGDFDHLILDSCADRRRLEMTVLLRQDEELQPGRSQEFLFDIVKVPLLSQEKYTMQQIQGIAQRAGATTKLGQVNYTSCGCDELFPPEDSMIE